MRRLLLSLSLSLSFLAAWAACNAQQVVSLDQGWRLQDVGRATQDGSVISSASFDDHAWLRAVVPGTVLTSFIADGIYPDPSYGENDRPESIPESLNKTAYWYRTTVAIPADYAGRHTWLRFAGINYSADVWVNGAHVGSMRGAFRRYAFDITSRVHAHSSAVIAVRIAPQPHPGVPHEHTLLAGIGGNGGDTAIDGPTFLSTIGWDWMPAIRDRDSGIWQPVTLKSIGDVVMHNPHIVAALKLPDTDHATLTASTTLENLTDHPLTATLRGSILSPEKSDKPIRIEQRVTLAAHESREVSFTPANTPQLAIHHPHLWWPNGYGEHPLYTLQLTAFATSAHPSDTSSTTFGIRQITYAHPGSDNLALSVNGVPIFVRGGDWGLDEELKRIPYSRLETDMRLHALAHLNLIRNWVGQSTSEDFYDLADRYGILIWDEFFQPNPHDGPNPAHLDTYLANVRAKVLRYRNHPSIALWCARNEGPPPAAIDGALKTMLPQLDPARLYQPSSTDGRGVHSGGPYRWRTPESFYVFPNTEAFKTEIGSVSVPTLDSIHGMLPQKDWETVNDDWAEHDFAKGNSGAQNFPAELTQRYGAPLNLADFVRKSQLMNYEAWRAMYEGRAAKLNAPVTAVIAWMSNPAQPSFVWQIYHYDFDPMSTFFAVQSAAEPVHVQWNEANDDIEVINNPNAALRGSVDVSAYAEDGTQIATQSFPFTAQPTSLQRVANFPAPTSTTPVVFVKLVLKNERGETITENVYWRGQNRDDLTTMNTMPTVELTATIAHPRIAQHEEQITVTLHNPTTHIAVMAHVQLRNAATNGRVLPAFPSANYLTLTPGESRSLTIDFDPTLLHGADPLLTLDGWNATLKSTSAFGIAAQTNIDAAPAHWPVTHLPYATAALR